MPSLEESLLLGAPELLLPLPLEELRLPGADDESGPHPIPGAAELHQLVSSLESVRPRVVELAAEARRILAGNGDSEPADEPEGKMTMTDGWVPMSDLGPLRHALHEVAGATARRLNLGLALAVTALEEPDVHRIRELHDWLRAARPEHGTWTELSVRLPRLLARVSKASLHGDLPDLLRAEVEAVRAAQARFTVDALIDPPENASPRKLRIGPHADTLRQLEAVQRAVGARLASYRYALSELWAAAAPPEGRTG